MEFALLACLSEVDRRRLLAMAVRRRYARREVLFHEGDPGDTLHLLRRGRVAVRVTTPSATWPRWSCSGPATSSGRWRCSTATPAAPPRRWPSNRPRRWRCTVTSSKRRARPARASTYARKSVEIREQALGPDHPAVAADVAALAAILEGKGEYDAAEALYRRAVAVFERVYGPDHYELAVNCNNLGVLAAARDDLAGAERLYDRALGIKERLLGSDHPDTAMTLHNLGALRASQGRVREAGELLRRALAVFEATLAPGHPKIRACEEALSGLDGDGA